MSKTHAETEKENMGTTAQTKKAERERERL